VSVVEVAPSEVAPSARGWRLVLAGCAIAALSSMCGIGGGLFAVPALHYLLGLRLERAVATSLCLVWCVALSATVSEALHPSGALYPRVIAALIGGSLLGTQLGFRLARRLPTRTLKAVFCAVLVLAGARVLALSGGEHASPDASFVAGTADLAISAAVGLAAGVAVPLLGVGGGLVVVPALLFALPQVGFAGARAAALAMAIVSASRSLWLYHGQGGIDWPRGLRFGLGGAAGAVAGVQLAHLGGAALGEGLLGAVLVLAAARFGWDALRAGR